jgi:hypothetical protein
VLLGELAAGLLFVLAAALLERVAAVLVVLLGELLPQAAIRSDTAIAGRETFRR